MPFHQPSEQSDSEHNRAIQQEFGRQAPGFANARFTHQLDWMIDELGPQPGDAVLDVAAGTGHIGRAIAPRARYVVALDLTPEMLRRGKAEADAAGLRNILFEQGDAAHLPYLDESFDLVTSRFAVHHFEDPKRQLAEMARVCRPGGRVGIVDLVASSDAAAAHEHNRLERLRDATHVEAFSLAGLMDLLQGVGLQVMRKSTRDARIELEAWLATTQPSEERAAQIRSALRAELTGGPTTGMRPLMQDDALYFTQEWAVVVASKP